MIEPMVIEIENCTPLSRYVDSERLARAIRLQELSTLAGSELYETIVLQEGNEFHLIFPPIVEDLGTTIHLIDGTHRLFAARETGILSITVTSVRSGHLPPLPCSPTRWQDIKVTTENIPRSKKLQGLNPALFRPATDVYNSSAYVFGTLSELLNSCNCLTEGYNTT